ncbi:TPA: DUF4145 domain-containing protein [Proteus mirabilis]|uniref:DUF4145 domain-containing protein n=2 Tax=Proteus mirabilis TaxID=584 RepID=UPI0029EDF0A1|nr:DUF4145 domain-containing protein [Proteus mirabilis]HEK2891585.1 DUF4145 domain-containing protein [Proteus mirabilis]
MKKYYLLGYLMLGSFTFNFFTVDSLPDWRCPACARQTLEFVPDSLKTGSTARARHYANDPDFSPDDDETIFTCLLQCNQKNCQQLVVVSGDGYYEREYDGYSSYDFHYISIYRPRYFYPPIHLFTPCDSYPEKIKEQLLELSAQLPGHPQAAINTLRTTLEIILDDFKIPRDKNEHYLSLDKRISLIPLEYKYMENGFRALKWLGNTGSHNLKKVSNEDIEGACIMLDDFLLKIYSLPIDHRATIARLTENHNPRAKYGSK